MDGKLYVTDANQEQVFEVDPTSGTARQVVEYPKSNRALTGVDGRPGRRALRRRVGLQQDHADHPGRQDRRRRHQAAYPVGVTFGPDGAMYVVEFTGRVLRAAPVGEEQRDVLAEGLRAPTAIAFGPDGNLYVSVHGQSAGQGEGQILRLRLAPPDPDLERRPLGERGRLGRRAGWSSPCCSGSAGTSASARPGWHSSGSATVRPLPAAQTERPSRPRSRAQPASDLDRADEHRVLLPGRGRLAGGW